ncbi:MAG: transglutaminase-like domain-containing protein [Verrucomicrobiales bacterium]|nr:transglutaminase-like domain-containing protein [Verrucomicrobiales bacterium]
MPFCAFFSRRIFAAAALLGFVTAARALTLEELQQDQLLSPRNFARHFADFRFRFRADVQSPDAFLASKIGDCDDYATLAADLLKAKGLTTRLVAVRMKKLVHVVCYVDEAGGYLDYNERAVGNGFVCSGKALSEIADKVAASLGARWASVSEFTYRDRLKRLVQTVLPAEVPRNRWMTQYPRGTQRDSS